MTPSRYVYSGDAEVLAAAIAAAGDPRVTPGDVRGMRPYVRLTTLLAQACDPARTRAEAEEMLVEAERHLAPLHTAVFAGTQLLDDARKGLGLDDQAVAKAPPKGRK